MPSDDAGVDQGPLAPNQDRVVGGIPRNPQALSDPGDGQADDHQAVKRPRQPTAGRASRVAGGRVAVLVSGLVGSRSERARGLPKRPDRLDGH